MRIPTKLKIGAVTYEVKLVKDLKDGSDSVDGLYDVTNNTISIDETLSQEAKEITFIHEILHACNSTMNHEFLDSLSEQIYQVFKENQLCFHYPNDNLLEGIKHTLTRA